MSTTAPQPLPAVQIEFRTEDLQEKLLSARDKVQEFADALASARKPVYEAATFMAVSSLGALYPLAQTCVAAYEAIIYLGPKVIEWFNDLIQWVWSPFNVVDLANALQKPYDHATACQQALIRSAMPADREWEGKAVDAYYAHIELHNAASLEAETTVKAMKDKIHEAGMAGVTATFVALGGILAGLIDAMVGIIGLIPPATPVGAGVIAVGVGLAGATIAALVAFASSAGDAIESLRSDLDGKMRGNAFPGGQWPRPTGKAVKSDIEDVKGWSYE